MVSVPVKVLYLLMGRMARYKIYQPASYAAVADTHGQVWAGETVAENIQLCAVQTIEPILLELLPKQGRILEAGCGLGRWVFYLTARGYDVTGIDLAREAIDEAKSFDPSAPVLYDDITRIGSPDETFEAAISLGVVEHFEEGPETALSELRRVLKPRGLLFVSVPVQNFLRIVFSNPLKDAYRWYRRRKGMEFAFEEYRYHRPFFTNLLRASGFDVLHIVPDDFHAPKNLGIYADLRFLRSKRGKWELNFPGKLLAGALGGFSPWAACAGALWVCRKSE